MAKLDYVAEASLYLRSDFIVSTFSSCALDLFRVLVLLFLIPPHLYSMVVLFRPPASFYVSTGVGKFPFEGGVRVVA